MHPDFDRYSDTYRDEMRRSIGFMGKDHGFFVRHKVDRLLELTRRWVGEPKDLSILDVGCGIGLTDAHLTEEFGSVYGVDVSEESLAIAKDANPTATYQGYDGETLPFSDGSFDVTFAIGVLHHVPVSARSRFIREMGRVTSSSGLAAILEHNPYNPLTRLAVDRCDFDRGVILPSRRFTSTLFGASGVRILEAPYILFFPFGGRVFRAIERGLGWLPLGAQYVVAGRKP